MIILHLFFRAKKNFLKHAGENLYQSHMSHSNSKQMYFANNDVKHFTKEVELISADGCEECAGGEEYLQCRSYSCSVSVIVGDSLVKVQG